jgi:hypothetical protein
VVRGLRGSSIWFSAVFTPLLVGLFSIAAVHSVPAFASIDKNPLSSQTESGILSTCGTGILRALQAGTDLNTLLRMAPQSADWPSPGSEAGSDTESGQPWVQQLVQLLKPLRAGGALVELLQSSFFHFALMEQAVEVGWAANGHERFSRFFARLSGPRQVQLLRALTVRLWIYTHRPAESFGNLAVAQIELDRYRELLVSFMAVGSDEIIQNFLARILFEADPTDADIHRILTRPEAVYGPDPVRVLFSKRMTVSEYRSMTAFLLSLETLDPHYPFMYWAHVHTAFLPKGMETAALDSISPDILSAGTRAGLAQFRLRTVDELYLSTLNQSVLKLQIQNLQWRLAMNRITSPHEVVDNLRRHIRETILLSEQGTNAASRLIAALSNFALRYLGLGWLGYSVDASDIAAYSGNVYEYLPQDLRLITDRLFVALDGLEEQLQDWARQAAALGDSTAIEAELARLQARLQPPR